jgi:hypothetical protein
MAGKISKSRKAKRIKQSKKAATKKRSKKTVAQRPSAKKPAAKRTKAPSTESKRVSKNQTRKAKRKPPKKNAWKISPQNHHAVYLAVFEKDGVTIELYQAFVHAFVIVDQKPNLTKSERDEGASTDKFNYSHYESSDAPEGPVWTFPDNFPPEQQEKIENLSREEYHGAMIKAGWTCYDKTRFYGRLSVEKVESEYPYDPV